MTFIRYILSRLYAFVVLGRNFMYDKGLLTQWIPPIKTICVGNLAVGGTGKTPHAIWILQLLQKECEIAFLSRGYKRQTKGFQEATEQSKTTQVGDEPLLVKKRFPDIPVAVCEQRVQGIKLLRKYYPTIACVLLDDAMQHRAVKPGKTLLLTAYDRLYVKDDFLPYGRLRDSIKEAKRADWIVVTKCPQDLTDEQKKSIKQQLCLLPHQKLFFSNIKYGLPRQLKGGLQREWKTIKNVNLITGIANPHYFEDYLCQHTKVMKSLHFPDHHAFTKTDIARIEQMAIEMHEGDILITTEKDAMRLLDVEDWKEEVYSRIYYVPIETEIIQEQEVFIEIVKDYVREN